MRNCSKEKLLNALGVAKTANLISLMRNCSKEKLLNALGVAKTANLISNHALLLEGEVVGVIKLAK